MSLNAFVTLVTTDSYVPGALVTINSVLEIEGQNPDNPFETVCLVTPATVSVESIKALRGNFSLVVGVEELRSGSNTELQLLGRQDLASTLTKLQLFRLIQFRKVIFLDADTLCLQPLSHLFSLDEPFSAAPDSGWPDCFNSGMFVATPSADTFDKLVKMSSERGSWDGGDQGLLNDFFPDWNRLSFAYNVTPSAYYTYAPAYRRHGAGMKLVHFIGSHKPWHESGSFRQQPNLEAGHHADYASLVNRWFDVYERFFAANGNSATFSFPTLQAIWDVPSLTAGNFGAYNPPSLQYLKPEFASHSSRQQEGQGLAMTNKRREGHYVSMPLEAGRPDLMGNLVFLPKADSSAPHFESNFSSATSAPGHVVSTAPIVHSGPPPVPPQTLSPQPSSPAAWTPPIVAWDPARTEPPKHDKPQMEQGFHQQYDNAWDELRSPSSRTFFAAPTYKAIPKVTFQNYDKVTRQHSPDLSKVKAIFPWENKASQSSRIFPQEPSRTFESVSVKTLSPSSPTRTASLAPSNGRDFSNLSSHYSNAWDTVPAIRHYADSMQPRPVHKRQGSNIGLNGTTTSAPTSRVSNGTLRGGKANGKQTQNGSTEIRILGHGGSGPRTEGGYETGGEASSRDGDDEDEDDEESSDDTRKQDRTITKPNVVISTAATSLASGRAGARSPPVNSSRQTANNIRSTDSPSTGNSIGTTLSSIDARPEAPKRYSSFQNMVNLTADIAAVSGSAEASDRPHSSTRRLSSRTSSSETVTPATIPILSPSLPNPSDGAYRSQRVSRIFDSRTDPEHIKKEGLDALHRFVRSMEARGAALNGASSSSPAGPGAPSIARSAGVQSHMHQGRQA